MERFIFLVIVPCATRRGHRHYVEVECRRLDCTEPWVVERLWAVPGPWPLPACTPRHDVTACATEEGLQELTCLAQEDWEGFCRHRRQASRRGGDRI